MDESTAAPAPTKEQILKADRERAAGITEVSQKFVGRVKDVDKMRDAAITSGISKEEFAGQIAMRLADDPEPVFTPDSKLGLNDSQVKEYSLLRAIQSQLSESGIKGEFEKECSDEIAKKTGKSTNGRFIPWEIQTRNFSQRYTRQEVMQLRALALQMGMNHAARVLTTTTSNASAELVGTQLLASNFIELLRNKSVADKIGVNILAGLTQNLSFPRQTGAGTAEGAA